MDLQYYRFKGGLKSLGMRLWRVSRNVKLNKNKSPGFASNESVVLEAFTSLRLRQNLLTLELWIYFPVSKIHRNACESDVSEKRSSLL